MIREPDLFISSGAHDKVGAEFLNWLFGDAARQGASDIHFLFQEQRCEISFRQSGALERVTTADTLLAKQIDEKLRSRSNMSAADRNIPLDGRFRLRFPDRTIDVRVSLIPIIGGQKIVCRLLDQTNAARKLESIEMSRSVRHCLDEVILEPQGLVLVCGPTGSGKTTTLYGVIGKLHNGLLNITTLEQPVEYVIPGIAQINIDQHVSFASGLRAVLRQDPDVILVGEIRDAETAQIAVQAANTGHMVLATIHANSAALAITRMVDMGADPQTLSTCLRAVVAQRLARRINPELAVARRPADASELLWLRENGIRVPSMNLPDVHSHDHYDGWVPVIEMIRMDARVRRAMQDGAGEMAILEAAARQPQFETIAQAGARLAASGISSLEQARRIVGEDCIVPGARRVGDVLVGRSVITPEQAQSAVDVQLHMRRRGKVVRFGEVLVFTGLCSTQEVIDAIGVTAGAPEMLAHRVKAGLIDALKLSDLVNEWGHLPPGSSLFDLCVANGLITKEELHEPSFVLGVGYQHLVAVYGHGAGRRPATHAAL
jgi:general secretion pathway protein E